MRLKHQQTSNNVRPQSTSENALEEEVNVYVDTGLK